MAVTLTNIESLGSVIGVVVDSMRVELSFLAVLCLLWLVGRYAGLRLDTNKRSPTKEKNCQSRPHVPSSSMLAGSSARPRPVRPRAPNVYGDDGAVDTSVCATQERLVDPTWLVARVLHLHRTQSDKAFDVYRSSRKAGLDLRKIPSGECDKLFVALVTSALRLGQIEETLRLFNDLRQSGLAIQLSLFVSATKLCTSKQLFPECLAIYDYVAQDDSFVVDDRSVWSCLLFCAMESKSYQRCGFFFERLKASGTPTHKDYGNMGRFAATQKNWQLSLSLVQEMRSLGVEIDSVIYNTALATCVSADQIDAARALLDEMATAGGVTDVITYNTLAKGYAKAGRMNQCFDLYDQMRQRGIVASQVTYGIMIDGCINENHMEKAAEVFTQMQNEGCPMNTVLYTMLMKGFVRVGQVDQAMNIYEQMRAEKSIAPDLITFSILIKANCDAGRLETSLQLLGAMVELGLKPDEVVFNNLLAGCTKDGNAELAKRLYKDMVQSGIRPSSATFSILIRLYSQCKILDEAVELMRIEPKAQKVPPEPRLFSQLIQCCLRERQGHNAVEVYKLMLDSAAPTTACHSSILAMCVKLNMLDTGVEILELTASTSGRVDARDAHQLLEATRKKRKTQCTEACAAAMTRLGIQAPQ